MKITARALIVNPKNQLLTVQHHGSSFWSLPGGKLDLNEDLKSALQREIFEELGVESSVKNLCFVHEFQYNSASDITVEFFFRVELQEENIEIFSGKYAQQELKKIQWNTLSPELDIKPDFLKNFSTITLPSAPVYFSYTS